MCGLLGISSFMTSNKSKKVFNELLYAGVFRGTDSTGVAKISRDERRRKGVGEKTGNSILCDIYKKADESYNILNQKEYKYWLSSCKPSVYLTTLMGHNRAATLGGIRDEDSHPYQEGDIILSHNGTLWDMSNLDDYKNYKIDSQCIAHNINKNGVEETVKRLRGAFALSWINTKENTYNFIRNSQRPLSIFTSKEDGSVFWASEEKMLEWILDRNGVSYEDSWEVSPGTHFEFDLLSDFWHYSYFNAYEYDLCSDEEPRKILYNNYREYYCPSDNKNEEIPNEREGISSFLHKTNISVIINEFTFYNKDSKIKNNDNGYISGYTLGYPYSPVDIEGVSEKEFNTLIKDEYVSVVPVKIEIINSIKRLSCNLYNPPKHEELSHRKMKKGRGKKYKDKDNIEIISYKSPYGIYINTNLMDEYTKNGCALCTGDIPVEDYRYVKWLDNNLPVCSSCSSDIEKSNEGINLRSAT